MKLAPQTPDQLRDALVRIFPDFEPEIDLDTSYGREVSFHTLMFDFTPFFGNHVESFSDRQMRSLGELINPSIKSPGTLENAVSTCFLEAKGKNRRLRAAMVSTRRPS
jgi:hypothetical protein